MINRVEEARLRLVGAKEDLEEADRNYMQVLTEIYGGEGDDTVDLGVVFDERLVMRGMQLAQFELNPIFDEHLFAQDKAKTTTHFREETARCEQEVKPLIRHLIGLWFTGRQADLMEQGGGFHFQFVAYLIELLFNSATKSDLTPCRLRAADHDDIVQAQARGGVC